MGISDKVCGVLIRVSDMLGCGTAIPKNEKVCSAINMTLDFLNCDGGNGDEGCSIIGCPDPSTYCDPVQDVCLIKKSSGDACNLNEECMSNTCNYGICE